MRTPEKRHNALAMQMLVRMATIERYSGLGTRPIPRQVAMRGKVELNAKAGGQIGLRPRLTIFKDLHPELYDQFKRTSIGSHNRLAMQMLVRMATIDCYEAIGVWGGDMDTVLSTVSAVDTKTETPVAKTAVKTKPAAIAPEPVKADEEPTTPSDSDNSSILALKMAVGDMFA